MDPTLKLISDQLDRIHSDVKDLRSDVREDMGDVYTKIESLRNELHNLNEKKIVPLQISKARILAYLSCVGLISGVGGSKIDKIFIKDEQTKVEKTLKGDNKHD